ncbi:hypothetical protein EMPS_07305 [Entomortierella parvispora]|uniref:F-box domain-containing protein n=1 Tax=Entomortierella parvispora TaxID=205924 RepID=A0A9P3LYA7_9FUNG|nr:hypothetical protein EMPS_07305 [Entomortierella parvispora]
MNESTITTAASILPAPFTTHAAIFDIHFLQSRICDHLDHLSLRRCTLVSSNFYVAFSPFLWRSIRIHRRSTYKRFIQPEAQAGLARHASRVREVSSTFPSVWAIFLSQPCPNLLVLDSPSLQSHGKRQSNIKYLPTVLELLQKSPHLQTLRLGYFKYEMDAVATFFETVRRHSSLKNMEIDHRDYVSCTLVRHMLWSTLKLERFSLNANVVGYLQRFTSEETQQNLIRLTGQEDPVFGLKDLTVQGLFYDHEQDTLFRFLKRCSNMERIAFPGMHWSRQVPILADIIAAFMPRLQHLDFSSLSIPGRFVARVVDKCQRLRTFIGNDRHDNSLPLLNAVLQHGDTLEVFRMHANDTLPSEGILRLLTTCSQLEVLDLMRLESRWMAPEEQHKWREYTRVHADRDGPALLDVADMDGDHGPLFCTPWACERLKVLRIHYRTPALESGEDEVQPKVLYEQLSALSRLEDLRLGWIQPPPSDLNDSNADGLVTSNLVTAFRRLHVVAEESAQDETPHQRARVQNVGVALQAWTQLKSLRKLELRGLKLFIEKDQIKKARRKWGDIEWIQYS